jgi:hypothetical protein
MASELGHAQLDRRTTWRQLESNVHLLTEGGDLPAPIYPLSFLGEHKSRGNKFNSNVHELMIQYRYMHDR